MQLETVSLIISTFISSVAIVSSLAAQFSKLRKISGGQTCLLRSRLLEIYYNNVDKRSLRLYEYDDFCDLFFAYKALGGNSFIDKIKNEIDNEWEVIR